MNTGKTILVLVSKSLSRNSPLMESARRGQHVVKRAITGPTKNAYKGNPWQHYILKYGEKPQYLKSKSGAATGLLLKYLFVLLVPLVATPFYMDYWINKHRAEGNPLLEEYETHLRAKRAKSAEGGDDIVVEEEEVLAHSAASTVTAATKDHYKYILVGGGTASHAAMKEILARDPEAEVQHQL